MAIIIALIAKSQNNPEPMVNETESNNPPVVTADIPTEFYDNAIETVTRKDLSEIKDSYWYLYNENDKNCYVFSFSNDSRIDISYLDLSTDTDSSFESGYSVYYQDGDDIILKYLPDCFPTKNFTLTLKNNEIFLGSTKLYREENLSEDIIKKHFNK